MPPRPAQISGVYAILGPNGVYVGESSDCWGRNTLGLAVLLGLECGIIREMPHQARLARTRAEREVAQLFQRRGLPVVSSFMGERYRKIRMVNRYDVNQQ